jgi:hypothetical protein
MANFISFSASGTAVMAAKLNTAGGVEQTGYIRSSEFGSGESGVFTPVISDRVDCDVTPLRGIYSRVNNVVTMTIYMSIVLDNAGGVGQFNVDLPVASTFETARDCYGTANLMTNPIDNMTYYIISADTATNKCAVEVQGNIGVSDVSVFVATIQYLVL